MANTEGETTNTYLLPLTHIPHPSKKMSKTHEGWNNVFVIGRVKKTRYSITTTSYIEKQGEVSKYIKSIKTTQGRKTGAVRLSPSISTMYPSGHRSWNRQQPNLYILKIVTWYSKQ